MNTSPERSRNLRIAYVISEDIGRESGVLKKIAMQMRIWKGLGHSVKLFAVSNAEGIWQGLREFDVDVTVVQKISQKISFNLLFNKIGPWAPDILYTRYLWLHPYIYKITGKFPSVMEINANDYVEVKPYLKTRKEYFKLIYWSLTRRSLYRRMDGFVFLSEEFKTLFSGYKKHGIVISNGIVLNDYRVADPPRNPRPRIVFIGSPSQKLTNGLDKILFLAGEMPDWDFDIIGSGSSPGTSANSTNIRMHGYLGKEQYEEIMCKADVAVGSIAVHRNDVQEASPLKVREYLAYGIPIIIGYTDTDFPEGAPFILRIPNTEDNVKTNLGPIKTFVTEWQGRRITHLDVKNIDAVSKEARRLEFLRQRA